MAFYLCNTSFDHFNLYIPKGCWSIVSSHVSRSHGQISFQSQYLSMMIPQPTLSEMHSKQPFDRLGKLRLDGIAISKFQTNNCSQWHVEWIVQGWLMKITHMHMCDRKKEPLWMVAKEVVDLYWRRWKSRLQGT